MRIIAGNMRGRTIEAPKGRDTRPTLDRVRESLFGILQFDLPGRRVLDLFAGSGSLGLEALSRGAADASVCDRDRGAQQAVSRNIACLGLEEQAQLFPVSYEAAIAMLAQRGVQVELVFLDPPYEAGLLEPAVAHLTAFDILNPHGIIVAEHPAERSLQPPAAPYRVRRAYRYGKIAVTVICRDPDQENEE